MDEALYLKNLRCNICKNNFKTIKIKSSKLRTVKRDTDFCIHYDGYCPYVYEINVCPYCGYAFSDSSNAKIPKELKIQFINEITKSWKKKNYCGERTYLKGVEAYKLAILAGQITKVNKSKISAMCMRIAWIYRIHNDTKGEQRFLKSSVNVLEEAFGCEDFSGQGSMDITTAVYLLGEINYRIGEYSKSLKWFNLCLSKYINRNRRDATTKMIRDRWSDIKSEIKQKSTELVC